MSKESFNININGHVLIEDMNSGIVHLDKSNDIHPQNMARIIARALAKENNYYIYRIAFGNGGTFTDASGKIVFRKPNTGVDGSGSQSRLYNEIYSEIVDETDVNVGADLGSSDANNTRPGGGASPADDPRPNSTTSQEVGTKSNIIVSVYLNENEPSGQTLDITTPSNGNDFIFDEIGLYSTGAPAKASPGYSTINVGDKTSTNNTTLATNTTYILTINVDGNDYVTNIQTPSSGSGTTGEITYGDLCDGVNSGNWVSSGDPIYDYIYLYITDDSNGIYSTILNKQSYGYLNFESKTTGSTSSVDITCTVGDSSDLANTLVSGICGNVNYTRENGLNAGVDNDPLNPANERERLLTHIIFSPITKTQSTPLGIEYTLTVSVVNVSTTVNNVNT